MSNFTRRETLALMGAATVSGLATPANAQSSNQGQGPAQGAANRTQDRFPKIAPYTLDYESYLALNRCAWSVDPSQAVLLIYDMQRWYVGRYENPEPLLTKIEAIRTAATRAGIPVIFAAAEPVRHVAERGIAADLWGPGIGSVTDARAEDEEMHPRLTPGRQDFIIRKRKYSAFFQTDLELLLRRLNRNQIILTGNYANHGCTVTAIDAYMRNFKVFFVADALGAFNAQSHDLALRYVADICGQIALADWVIKKINAA